MTKFFVAKGGCYHSDLYFNRTSGVNERRSLGFRMIVKKNENKR